MPRTQQTEGRLDVLATRMLARIVEQSDDLALQGWHRQFAPSIAELARQQLGPYEDDEDGDEEEYDEDEDEDDDDDDDDDDEDEDGEDEDGDEEEYDDGEEDEDEDEGDGEVIEAEFEEA